MPLNSTPLKNKLESNREKPETSPVDIAMQITDWYHDQVMSNTRDLTYGNSPLLVNKSGFYNALSPAYVDIESSEKSSNESQLSIIASAHEAASIAYWTGATLSKTNPPPAAVKIIENPVLNPGSFSVSIPSINKLSGYVSLIVSAHETHLKTISGQAVSQMPDGTVQNFPWNSIG